MKTAAVLSFSDRGGETARRIARALEGEYEITLAEPRGNMRAVTGELFASRDALIFVGACGIAVRAVAPYVVSKTTDPAVLVVDELGRHVISLLSGHIGGANALCWKLAAALDGEAVITTATDVNHRFSVDAWAASHGMSISSMPLAKRFSAQILKRDLPLWSEFPIDGALPGGIYLSREGELGAAVTCHTGEVFASTLRLIPRVLTVGIGCRRNTPEETIAAAVEEAFSENGLSPDAVSRFASIDVKSDEAGLLAYAKERGREILFFSAEQLCGVPGTFSASAFVAGTVGVDNVCERSAVLAAGDGAELIVKKIGKNGVTVAVAREKRRISFE